MAYVQKILERELKPCVLIPSYNESKSIGKLVGDLKKKSFEVLVVDDGSEDDTAEIAGENGARVIRHDKNLGKGRSLRTGFEYLLNRGFETIITMDGDYQHLPEDVDRLIKKREATQADMIIGNRMQHTEDMPALRRLTNRTMSLIISVIARQYIPDSQCGLRLLSSKVLKDMKLTASNYDIESELIFEAARRGYKIEYAPIKTVYSGQNSKINSFFDTLRFLVLLFRRLLC